MMKRWEGYGYDALYWLLAWGPLARSLDVVRPPVPDLIDLAENRRIQPCRCLDVGCGIGGDTRYLASQGFEATGIDISAVIIKKAKAKARKEKIECTFEAMDFLDSEAVRGLNGPFDLVIDGSCLFSMSDRGRLAYGPALRRVTRPGSDYLLWTGSTGRHSPQRTKRLFSDDFEVVEERPVDGYRFYWMRRVG